MNFNYTTSQFIFFLFKFNLSKINRSYLKTMSNSKLYSFNVRTLKGNEYNFNQLKGKVVIITNVASEVDYIPQYQALEALYQKYRGQGLEIIGFPCNQFGENEPGNAEDIQRHLTKYIIHF